jgi:hypothetical protein
MQHICDMFGVRQTDDRTTPKSTRWNIYRAALYYAWGPADVASDTRRVCTHKLCRSLRECSLFVSSRRENEANPPSHPFILYISGSLRVTRHTNLICPPAPGSLGTARGLLSLSGLT